MSASPNTDPHPSFLTRALPSLALDVKLGLRMVVKYPMLTAIGGIAITVAATLAVGISEGAHRQLVTKATKKKYTVTTRRSPRIATQACKVRSLLCPSAV